MQGGTFVYVLFAIGVLIKIGVHLLRWRHNNTKPQISLEARVDFIDDRRSSEYVWKWFGHSYTHTRNHDPGYTIDFESLPRGKRKKLWVPISEPDTDCEFAKGDVGTLTFQGTRFISFKKSS